MKVGDLVSLTIIPQIGIIIGIVAEKGWAQDQVYIYLPNKKTVWSCAKYYVKVIQ
jgi:hypothetical protein